MNSLTDFPTFFIVAGEASADLLGADLIQSLQAYYPNARFEGIAGPRMQAVGCQSILPMETLSHMGIVDVITHLPHILKAHRAIIRRIDLTRPSIFIGIDLPDTNLRIARKIKRWGIPVVQYVSPSVWAWRQNRLNLIKKVVDLVLPLFPFEAEFYQANNIPAEAVGHSLADKLKRHPDKHKAKLALGLDPEQPVIALLPGSRWGEIKRHASIFIQTALRCYKANPRFQFLLPVLSDEQETYIKACLKRVDYLPIQILKGQSHEVLVASDMALLVSGTATLEAMFCHCPMVVAYQLPNGLFHLIKPFIKVSYISLPNLLIQDRVVPEYVQEDVNPDCLSQALMAISQLSSEQRLKLLGYFDEQHEKLEGGASQKAAKAIKGLILG